MTDPVPTGIDDVYEQLERVSRRAVARARRRSAPLTFVEHSLLDVIEAEPGRRAIDIAAEFSLNRSTVSRQLAHLVELGLIVADGPADDVSAEAGGHDARRGQRLSVTPAGRDLLARSVEANRAALADRLRGWHETEVDALAASLRRLNSAYAETSGDATRDGGPRG